MKKVREFSGQLLYTGWSAVPWRLAESEFVDVYLLSVVGEFLASLNGRRIRQELGRNSYILAADETGVRIEHSGISRIHLGETFVWLSGRMVCIRVEAGASLRITATPARGIAYFTNGNPSCKVPRGAEKTFCRVGRKDRCVFLSESPGGFVCNKFGPNALKILEQLPKDSVRAAYTGSCALR